MMVTRFQEPAGNNRSDIRIRILMTGARSAFIGPNLIHETYRTAVATIVVGLDQDVAIRWMESGDESVRPGPIAVIPPDSLCELDASGDIALLFTDALTDDCSEIDVRLVEARIEQLRKALKDAPGKCSSDSCLRNVFSQLGVISQMPARQEIARVVAELGRWPEDFATVERAAALAGLSPMRFQHVFTETVGIPFRRYRQWRRMGRVMRELADGCNLTEAAYAAGFSNSAHLSTAFKAMFGLRPSDLLANRVEYFLTDAEFGTDARDGSDET